MLLPESCLVTTEMRNTPVANTHISPSSGVSVLYSWVMHIQFHCAWNLCCEMASTFDGTLHRFILDASFWENECALCKYSLTILIIWRRTNVLKTCSSEIPLHNYWSSIFREVLKTTPLFLGLEIILILPWGYFFMVVVCVLNIYVRISSDTNVLKRITFKLMSFRLVFVIQGHYMERFILV